MPLYEVELEDGRRFEVDADAPPTEQDLYAYLNQPAQSQPQAPAPEPDLPFFSFGDLASGVGTAIAGVPVTTKAAYYRMLEGFTRPDLISEDAKQAFAEEAAFNQKVQSEQEQRRQQGLSTDVGEAFRAAAPSVGFSLGALGAAAPSGLAGMGGGSVAGGVIGAALGGPPGAALGAGIGKAVGGVVSAGLAAGTAAYRMAGSQFLSDAFDAMNAKSIAETGQPMSEEEKEALYQEILPWAENTALWEAGPEAVSNAALAVGGPVVLRLGKPLFENLVKSAAAKVGLRVGAAAGLAGTELATETATELGQAPERAKVDMLAQGLPPEQAVSPYAPGLPGAVEAFKEIAPATLATSALFGGAGAAVKGTVSGARAVGRMVSPPVVQTDEQNVPVTFNEVLRERVETPEQAQVVTAAEAAANVATDVEANAPMVAEELRAEAATAAVAAVAPAAVPPLVAAEEAVAPVVAEEEAPLAVPPVEPAPEIAPSILDAQSAVNAWQQQNRTTWTDDLQEGELISNTAFDAVAEQGRDIPAHGMAKASPAKALADLLGILTNGITVNESGRGLFYAPLAKPRGEAGLSTTAGGVAVRDGPFILVGAPGSDMTNADQIRAVLVNPALDAETQAKVRAAVQSIRPDIQVESFTDVAKIVQPTAQPAPVNAPQPILPEQPVPTPQAEAEVAPTSPETPVVQPASSQTLAERLRASTSRKEAQEIIETATLAQLREAAEVLKYPSSGSKKDLAQRLVAAVGSRADAQAILNAGKALQPETPPLETTPDATLQGQVPSNHIEERVQTDEGRNAAEASRGSRPLVSGQVQTAAQEGQVTQPPAASERATDKPLELKTPDELAKIGIDLDVAQAVARYEAARASNNVREGMLAEAAIASARSGNGPQARQAQLAQQEAVSRAVTEQKPVAAEAMRIWANEVTSYGFDASGNLPRRGIPEGYVREGDLYVYRPSVAAPTLQTSTAQETVAPAPSPPSQAVQGAGMTPKQWAKSLPDADQGTGKPNQIISPQQGNFKEGQITADQYGDDPYIYRDEWIDVADFDPRVSEDFVGLEGLPYESVAKMETTQKYIEWYRQGFFGPPITVVKNTVTGRGKSNNRRRIVAALEAGVRRIPARVEIGRASEIMPISTGQTIPQSTPTVEPQIASAPSPAIPQVGDAVVYREQGQDIEGTFTSLDNFGRAVIQRPDGSVARSRVQSLRPLPSARGQSGRQESGQAASSTAPPETGSSAGVAPAIISETTEKSIAQSAMERLRIMNAELPAAALARWTDDVYNRATEYFTTGNASAIAGLNNIQRGRIERALQEATPGAVEAIEAREAVEEKRMAKRERKDAEFAGRTTFKTEEIPGATVYLSERGQGSINLDGGLGISKERAQQVVDEFAMVAPNAPAAIVVNRQEALTSKSPFFTALQEGVASGDINIDTVEGWYNFPHGPAFLVYDNLSSMGRARQVLIHETLGHYGIDSFTTARERKQLADAIRRTAPEIDQDVRERYTLPDEGMDREVIAAFMELMEAADPANTPSSWRALWERIKRLVRGIIRRLGGDPNAFDDYDIYTFVTAAQRRVVQGLSPDEARQLRDLQRGTSFSLGAAERSMSTQARLMADAEVELEQQWNWTQATQDRRTADGVPVAPVAYEQMTIPSAVQAANAWLDAFKAEYADLAAREKGKVLLRTLFTRISPSGRALSDAMVTMISMPLITQNRIYEFNLASNEVQLANRSNASDAARALRLQQEFYDPMDELKSKVRETTTKKMEETGTKFEELERTSEEDQKRVVAEVATETAASPATIPAINQSASPRQDVPELQKFLRWMSNQDVEGIERLDQFAQKFVQLSRFDVEAFTAAIRKAFPQLETAVVDTAVELMVQRLTAPSPIPPVMRSNLEDPPNNTRGRQPITQGAHLPPSRTLREQLEQDGAQRIADAFFRGDPKKAKEIGPLSEGSMFVNQELTGLLNEALDRLGVQRPEANKPKDQEMRRLIVELGLMDLRQGKLQEIDRLVRERLTAIAETGAVDTARAMLKQWETVSDTMRSTTASDASLRRALSVVMREQKKSVQKWAPLPLVDSRREGRAIVRTVMDRVKAVGTPEAGGVDQQMLDRLEADLMAEMDRQIVEAHEKRKKTLADRELRRNSPEEVDKRAKIIVDSLARELSDTPPTERAKVQGDPVKQLVRDAIASNEPMFRFKELAAGLGVSESTATTMAMLVEEARSRRLEVQEAQRLGRLEEARQRAITRFIEGLMFDPQNRKNKEPLGRFMSSLVRASQYGVLDSETFARAFGTSFGLDQLTPQVLKQISDLYQKLSAVDAGGQQILFGMEREQVARAFKEMVNSVAPAARWDNVLYNNFIARVLASVSSVTAQLSGLFRVMSGMSAIQRSVVRGNLRNFVREWWQNYRDIFEALPVSIAAVQGNVLGMYPTDVQGRFTPTEQSLMLTPKGQTFRVSIGGKVVTMPEPMRKFLRAMELFTWRLFAGVEGISGIVDAKGIARDVYTRHFIEQGSSPQEAYEKAMKLLAWSPEDKAQALEQARQEQREGRIGNSKALLNLRAEQILQRNANVKLNADLTASVEQLTAASQFKTQPVGVVGSAIYHFFNNIGTSDSNAARLARYWLIFGRFLGHTFDTMLAWSPLGYLTTTPKADSPRGRAIRQIYGSLENYKRQQYAKATASVGFLMTTASLQALAILLAGDDEEPFFQVFGTAPMASFADKEQMTATGQWREGTLRVFGQEFNYMQVPEMAALFTTLGNISDYIRFGQALYRGKEGEPVDIADASFFGATDVILSPVKRNTYRQYFKFLNGVMEGKPGDAGWNLLTTPLGGLMRFPLVVDADKMFREAEGSRDAKGFVENALRRIPFVHVGESMYNGFGEKMPGFGLISMFPPDQETSPAVQKAARVNVYTGTVRSEPSDVQMIGGQEVPRETRDEYVRRAGAYYVQMINQNAQSLMNLYDQNGHEAAKKMVAKISAAANERARAELQLQSKR